jgi:hypothetical protein
MSTVQKAKQFPSNPLRVRMYTRLAVANAQLKKVRPEFTDDDYRHILKMHGAQLVDDKYSAKTMTVQQLGAALSHFHDLGFRMSAKVAREAGKTPKTWKSPRIGKLNALWCSLADAGVINDRSEQAMQRYCENNVRGLTKFEWITSDQLNKAIEMLKQMHVQRGLTLK